MLAAAAADEADGASKPKTRLQEHACYVRFGRIAAEAWLIRRFAAQQSTH